MNGKENLTIALLIDAENVSSEYMEEVEEKLIALGKVTYKRVYGNFDGKQLKGWRDLVNDHALQPIHLYSYTKGKNASDSKMIIDAMDILYSGNVNAMCIMSSDSDFTGLVKRLKESNVMVIGAGEKKTPQSFVNACDRFFILGEKEAPATEPTAKSEGTPLKAPKAPKKERQPVEKEKAKTVTVIKKSVIEKFVVQLLEASNEELVSLEWVITKIGQKYPQFNFKDYGARKSYEFFDKRKFILSCINDSNWMISLK